MNDKDLAYAPYDGLKLPNERQRNLTNTQLLDLRYSHLNVPASPCDGASLEGEDTAEVIPYEIVPAARWYPTSPGTYDWEEAKERGMYDEDLYAFNDKFFYIQALYRKGLDRMLVEKFGLDGYDREIGRQSKYFAPEDIEASIEVTATYYWPSFSMMNLGYIFLRNSVHVERLEGEGLRVFENAYDERATEVSVGMNEVIERTWKYFINVDPEGKSFLVAYSSKGGAPPSALDGDPTTDTLILEIQIGNNFTDEDKDENGFILDEPLEVYNSGVNKVKRLIVPHMEREISRKAGIPVKIEVYA